MFTGIVQALGTIRSLRSNADGARLEIDTGTLDVSDLAIGDSVAVNGVCLTAIAVSQRGFQADVSPETLNCVSPFVLNGAVNLEKALRLADRLGGHLLSGHVDGIGQLSAVESLAENRVIGVRLPDQLTRYVARKGSIAINGVSLTVNQVRDAEFSVNLIPHTLVVTNLKQLVPGSVVNLEVDMIARYVERMMQQERA